MTNGIELSSNFRAFAKYLQREGSPLPSKLIDGVSNNIAVERLSETLEDQPHDDIVSFFTTFNGVRITSEDTLDAIQIVPGYFPLGLEDATSAYLTLKKIDFWPESLFPILGDGMGFFICVDADLKSNTTGAVYEYIQGYAPERTFDSLNAMIMTYRAAFERKIFKVLSQGGFEGSQNEFAACAQELNPEIGFWRDCHLN